MHIERELKFRLPADAGRDLWRILPGAPVPARRRLDSTYFVHSRFPFARRARGVAPAARRAQANLVLQERFARHARRAPAQGVGGASAARKVLPRRAALRGDQSRRVWT